MLSELIFIHKNFPSIFLYPLQLWLDFKYLNLRNIHICAQMSVFFLASWRQNLAYYARQKQAGVVMTPRGTAPDTRFSSSQSWWPKFEHDGLFAPLLAHFAFFCKIACPEWHLIMLLGQKISFINHLSSSTTNGRCLMIYKNAWLAIN